MANELQADKNTYVGYSFPTAEFYVRNFDTRTVASSAEEAKLILDTISPNNTIPLIGSGGIIGISDLSSRHEPIVSINYTLEDTGKYIKNIYFNEYKSFALQYDEPNLYILNANEIWNMSSSINYTTVASYLFQYYYNYLGVNVTHELMTAIVKYFKDAQSPYAYNVITSRTDDDKLKKAPLTYSNIIKTNNMNKQSRGEYNSIKNPNDEVVVPIYEVTSVGSTVVTKLYGVDNINANLNKIYLNDNYHSSFSANDKIRLYGTGVVGLDGDYIIASVDTPAVIPALTNLTIKSETPLQYNYNGLQNPNVLMKLINDVPETETVSNAKIIEINEEPDCIKGDIVQLVGNKYKKNLFISSTGRSADVGTSYRYTLYTTENVNAETNAQKTETHVYINAYSIAYCGYDNYNTIKSSVQIKNTDTTNKRIYILTTLKNGDYPNGTTIYVRQSNNTLTALTVASTTPSSYNASTGVFNNGYLTTVETPPSITYYAGVDPNYVQIINTAQVAENSFTLDLPSGTSMPVKEGDTFTVLNAPDDTLGVYTVLKTEGSKVYMKPLKDEIVPEHTFNENDRALLQVSVPSKKILLNMTYSKNIEKLPTGSFMFENDQQLTNYLTLFKTVTPTNQNYADLNQEVSTKYTLRTASGDIEMNCVGLYSEVYGN